MIEERNLYESRTQKSKALWEKANKVLPMGTASNARAYDPYPLFIAGAAGSRLVDVDGNEYVDYNLSFGALLTGHRHPVVLEAVRKQLSLGTMYGMCHDLEAEVAEEILKRYPFLAKVRFASTGTEATMHAIRLAKSYTGRDYIVKMEGAYHGLHDAVMISVKPLAGQWGPGFEPLSVPFGEGVSTNLTHVAQFNDLRSLELSLDKVFPDQVAAVIVEPVMMNMGVLLPFPSYLQSIRELCTKYGALLIFDEVKSGGIGYGGAASEFEVTPDIVCLSKSIGGGFPLAAFGASLSIMKVIEDRRMFHAGTYNANPISMAAGLATLKYVLTRDAYGQARTLSDLLAVGYKRILTENGISGLVTNVGVNGSVAFGVDTIRSYRDWAKADMNMWERYWLGMVNRGVIPQPYGGDEEWTVSVVHTEEDIIRHLEVLAEVARSLKEKARAAS